MRLFVLAAGKGKRMDTLTADVPKCLVDLGDGSTLLGRLASAVCAVGSIDELVIIAGHKAGCVEEALTQMNLSIKTKVLYNPFYKITGPLVSLWLAYPWMVEVDFLVCNGDTYYSPQTLARIAQADRGITIGIDSSASLGDDSMKVVLDEIGRLRQVSKEIRTEYANGVSTGLLRVCSADMRRVFTTTVCRMLREDENTQPWIAWHSVLNHLVAQGVLVEVVELAPTDWHEIDTLNDLCDLRALILLGK